MVSYWADKSATTTAWTPEASVRAGAACGATPGRICSALADSGPVLAGTNGPVGDHRDAQRDRDGVVGGACPAPLT